MTKLRLLGEIVGVLFVTAIIVIFCTFIGFRAVAGMRPNFLVLALWFLITMNIYQVIVGIGVTTLLRDKQVEKSEVVAWLIAPSILMVSISLNQLNAALSYSLFCALCLTTCARIRWHMLRASDSDVHSLLPPPKEE